MSAIRVLHLAARLPVGGMEMVVANLVRHLPAPFLSSVCCLEERDHLGDELARTGVTVFDLGCRRARDVTLFSKIARLVRREGVDILHCHDELAWFYGVIGSRLALFNRVVMTVHGRRPGISRRHLIEQRILASMTAAVVSVSEFLRQQLVSDGGIPARRLRVIHNGIVITETSGAAERDRARATFGADANMFVIGCVGELSPVKNLGLLLEAAALMRPAIGALKVVLIGDGAERVALERAAAAQGLEHIVQFLGVRRDVSELLPGLDAYVCTSKYEGISLAILEAMSASRAIVATAVGGNPELIENGRSGLLVPNGSAVDVAGALVELARFPQKRRELGEAARLAASTAYSVERMIRDYDALYRHVSVRPLPPPPRTSVFDYDAAR